MKKSLVFLSIIFLFVQFQNVEAQKKRPVPKPKILSAREIASKVLPSVVIIITQDENGEPISQGSGFVYKPGLVVSNLHVFERATNAIVKNVKTGEISKAIEVVGMNAVDDICVIRIDNTKFPTLALGDSSKVQTGDQIFVASNPKGLEGSFTSGIVSGIRKSERESRPVSGATGLEVLDQFILGQKIQLIQIDAAISPGSSGGLVVNSKAEAIGIARSSLIGGQNLNFAIPSNVLNQLPLRFKHSIQLAGACAYKDRDKEKLNGLVKTVVEKSRYNRVENGRLIESRLIINSVRTYDIDGNEIESITYQVDGKLAWKFKFKYDENRLKTSYVQEFMDGSIKQSTFDLENGIYNKLFNRKFSGSIGLVDKPGGMQVFDSNGNMIIWYIGNAKLTYEYDDEGRAKENIQWRDGKVQRRTRYRYKDDNASNWIEKYELTNYPSGTSVTRPDEWMEGETEYREITYFDQ